MLHFHKFIFFKVRKLPKKLPKKPVSSKKRQSKVRNQQRNWLLQPPHSQTNWRRLKLVWRLKLTLQPMMKYLLWVLWKKPIKPRPRRKMPLKKWPRQSKSLKRSQQFCQRFKSLVSLYIQPGRLSLRMICFCQAIFCAWLLSVLLPTHLHYRLGISTSISNPFARKRVGSSKSSTNNLNDNLLPYRSIGPKIKFLI